MVSNLFPQRLRICRKRKGISCSVLSELCGMSKNMVSRYESGSQVPTLNSAVQLANVLDVSLDWLCGRV